MDANGQRFWLWSAPRDFPRLDDCAFRQRLLQLDRERLRPVEPDRALRAEERLAQLPWLRDAQGTLARWDEAERVLRGFGALPGSVAVPGTGAPAAPRDLALDAQQIVLLAFDGFVDLVDLRERFEPIRLALPLLGGGDTLLPHKLACDGRGGRWLLDRRHRRLARIAGTPWRRRAFVAFAADTFRPQPENADDARIELLDTELPAEFDFVAVAASRDGRVLLGSWGPDGRFFVHPLAALGPRWVLETPRELAGADHGHALKWIDERLIAVRAGDLDEALVFDADDADRPLDLVGSRYPLRRALDGPFVQGQDWPPHYPCAPEPLGDEYAPVHSRPLVPLSWRALRAAGTAVGRVIDAGRFDVVWHRACIEAEVPAGCGIVLELAATDDDIDPPDEAFAPHWIGDAAAQPAALGEVPRAAWCAHASELPFHPGWLPVERAPQRAGLFIVLVQRAGHRLRDLRGRYLHLRLRLLGNGRRSPCIAALRIYGERYSYVSHYLPELYRDESVFDRDARGTATPPDFFERFTQLFESELTRWEDLAAAARVLTQPTSCPPAALPWLAEFSGIRLPPALPPERARDWIASAAARGRRRGTLAGLEQALEVASGGWVSRGAIVVVEDFRLRRTVATLLGVDMARDDDPLLPGLVQSGNSFVGDTLILGDEAVERDFLAAFLPEALQAEPGADAAQQLTESFYARTAHRATVLVHEDLHEDLRRLIEAIAAEEAPAHVEVKVLAARERFLVGVAALVGVDSYLREPVDPQVARIDASRIGRGDRIAGGAAFDWRLEAGWAPAGDPPTAVIDGPSVVSPGVDFTLSGARSFAAPGHDLRRYAWTRRP
jgi:phage tail-like protein